MPIMTLNFACGTSIGSKKMAQVKYEFIHKSLCKTACLRHWEKNELGIAILKFQIESAKYITLWPHIEDTLFSQ